MDDFFKKKALRLWNVKHGCILLRRTHYFQQDKAKSMAAQFILLSQKQSELIKGRDGWGKFV